VNIITENEKIVEEAVRTYALGEDVHWAISMNVIPGPDGNPQPILCILVTLPGIDIGQRLQAQTLSPDMGINTAISDAVKNMIEQLKTVRSQQATDALSAPQPRLNGQGDHPPGLIDPRQGM